MPYGCENDFASNVFQAGDLVYFSNFYHDQKIGQLSIYKIFRPDGSLWKQWTHNSPDTYNSSWWYWSWFLPFSPQYGIWRYEVSFSGQVENHYFAVVPSGCPDEMEVPGAQGIPQGNYKASIHLHSSGKVLRRQVSFTAGDSLTLSPGFFVLRGSDFSASIQNCSAFSKVAETNTKAQEEQIAKTQEANALSLSLQPNPSSGEPVFLYWEQPMEGAVTLSVYDQMGIPVISLLQDQQRPKGRHGMEIAVGNLQPGMYFVVLDAHGKRKVGKMILME